MNRVRANRRYSKSKRTQFALFGGFVLVQRDGDDPFVNCLHTAFRQCQSQAGSDYRT